MLKTHLFAIYGISIFLSIGYACNSKVRSSNNNLIGVQGTECSLTKQNALYNTIIRTKSNQLVNELCYDKHKHTTILSHHFINPSEVKCSDDTVGNQQNSTSDSRIPFQSRYAELNQTAYEKYYNKDSQEKILYDVTGRNEYFNSRNSYLARSHLTPSADFSDEFKRRETFDYVNTIPQWQQINNANWKSIENRIRRLVCQNQTSLHVLTGNSGTLKLNNKEIYLYPTNARRGTFKMYVPKWTWKIITSHNAGIALLTLNNPFINTTDLPKHQQLCTNICDRLHTYNWYDSTFTVPKEGLTFCCTVNDFIRRKDFHNLQQFQRSEILWGSDKRRNVFSQRNRRIGS